MEQRHFDIVNHATPRLESMDKALGRGKYTDDLELPNMAYAALVRCPYSHAKVLSIDVSEAEKVPGFLGCALPEEAPQAYFNCSGNPPSPLLMADEKVLTTEPLTIGAAWPSSLTAPPQIRNIATVGGNIMQDRRCIYFNQPHLWRSGTDLKSLIERHSVANGLACHEHLPILVTRFFVPAAEEGERSGFYKYAMRTTIDFPIINFALRCGGNRPARLAAGAVAPHPVVMAETAAKIDSDATDDEVIAQAEDELRKLAMPIKETCMTPAVKRSLYRHVAMLLDLRK